MGTAGSWTMAGSEGKLGSGAGKLKSTSFTEERRDHYLTDHHLAMWHTGRNAIHPKAGCSVRDFK